MGTFNIIYSFEHRDGRKKEYYLTLDSETLSLTPRQTASTQPAWTKLEVSQCSICPLKKEESPHCPIAVNLAELVENFKNDFSTEEVIVRVTTPDRTYLKETSLQVGIASISGVIMATSGCPIMNFLKPMARFHLPFSTHVETVVRSTSMYLLRQYFLNLKAGKFDIGLTGLNQKYEEIKKVNEGILGRIRTIEQSGDVGGNSLVIFHTLSQLLTWNIGENLSSIEFLFKEK